MRHNKKFNHLGRQAAHRGAMLSNMSTSLIMHKRIFTTTAKAKALKIVVEPLITKAKEDTTANRRLVFSSLQQKEAVTELFQVVAPKVGDRPGGYTRIIKTGFRLGDNAAMCFIELVDFNDNMLKTKVDKKAKTRRSSVKKKADAVEVTPVASTPIEKAAPVAEEVVAKEVVIETPVVEAPAVETPAAEAAEAPVAE
jgi:large subunit ribosomal protein L17